MLYDIQLEIVTEHHNKIDENKKSYISFSHLGLMKTVKWRKEILGSGIGPVITIK